MKREIPISARVDTHGLFRESEHLKAIAQNVLGKLDGTKRERTNLKRFVAALDDIQSAIKDACETMEGGNPMFHDFKIKCRA